MGKVPVLKGIGVGALFCCGLLGCVTFPSSPTPSTDIPDPFIEEIARQEIIFRLPTFAILSPEIILREVPLQTPVEQARSFMAGHGFSCWRGVPDTKGTCLLCKAYRQKTPTTADRIVVKFFYDQKRVVSVEIIDEYDVTRRQ
jgi:hypothetical protein